MDFGILGPLEVRDGGRPVIVNGVRQRGLLAILLLHAGDVVSSDRLVDDLWGDAPPAAGAAALRMRVTQLRRALPDGHEVLLTRSPGYVLVVEPGHLDVQRFERLLANGRDALARGEAARARGLLGDALGLWRGPPLDDFAYAPFAQAAIARLEELRLAALELRVESDLALGRHAHVTAELREIVAEHPLRERFCAQLMLALYRGGRQAEALTAYRVARHQLVEEVGIEPGPELRALEARVLAQDAALSLGSPPLAQPPRQVMLLRSGALPAEPLAGVAEDLARGAGHELVVVVLLSDAERLWPTTAELNALRERALTRGVAARAAAFTSDDRGRDVLRLCGEEDVALLVLDAADALDPDGMPDAAMTQVLTRAACDVALLADASSVTGSSAGRVVVPFSGHEHDWAALEIGAWLADARGEVLRLLGTGAAGSRSGRDASRLLGHASLALQRGQGIAAESELVRGGSDGVIAGAKDASVLVVGLSDRWRREGIGRSRLEIARRAGVPVLFVRRGLRPGGLAPAEALTRFTWSAVGS